MNIFNLESEIYVLELRRILPPDVRQALIQYAIDNQRFSLANDFKTLESNVRNIQNSIQAKQRLINIARDLAGIKPFLLHYSFDCAPVVTKSENPQTNAILQSIAKYGETWKLQELSGVNNRWCDQRKARIHEPVTIYRLSKDDAFAEIVIADAVAHVVMLRVCDDKLSRFYPFRNALKSIFNIMIDAGCDMLSGVALTNVEKNPLPIKDWRNTVVTTDCGIIRKLPLLYQKIGAIDANGTLLYLSRECALDSKSATIAAGFPNPYRLLSVKHSIYSPDIAAQLVS